MKLKPALQYIGLSKSSYFYKSHPNLNRNQPYSLDPVLKNVLLNLKGYELTLGYKKLKTYLYWTHQVIWNKKKIYRHMRILHLLQPKRIKQRWIQNKRLPFYNVIHSNVRWEADLTFVPTAMGNVHLFVVQDVFDKELLGGHMDLLCGANQAIECLKEALVNRFGQEEPSGCLTLTLRIDRGCQFTANDFITYAESKGIKLEFCGVQTPNDKPYIESFISCYKREEVYRNYYEDFFEAYEGWKKYVFWYNHQRPHGSLDYNTPASFRALTAFRERLCDEEIEVLEGQKNCFINNNIVYLLYR